MSRVNERMLVVHFNYGRGYNISGWSLNGPMGCIIISRIAGNVSLLSPPS